MEDEEKSQELETDINDGKFLTYNSDEDDEDDDHYEKVVDKKKKYGDDEDYQRPSKLELIVGFLRCFNFLSCATSVFSVALSLLFTLEENPDIIQDYWSVQIFFFSTKIRFYFLVRNNFDFIIALKIVSSSILLLYLIVISFVIMVDAVGTVTFRWREYGEVI